MKNILLQFDNIIIVDNASSKSCLGMLRDISKNPKIHLVENEKNHGVATALNIGFRIAKDRHENLDWCLTLDQDTLIYSNFFENLISSYTDCNLNQNVGIIGSNYEEWTTGKILYKNENIIHKWAEVENLPTSGCLTSIKMFNVIGEFKDSFFIDYVDTEYCLRAKENGFKIIICHRIGMKHPLGYYKKSKLFNFIFSRELITNYPAFRHYYWTRNGITLAFLKMLKKPVWSLRELYYLLIRRVAIVLLFEDNKILKLKNIAMGVFHSICMRSGEM